MFLEYGRENAQKLSKKSETYREIMMVWSYRVSFDVILGRLISAGNIV